MDSLSVIKQSNLLKEEDFSVLKSLQEALENVFEVVQVFRTRTEMEVSILNDLHFPTPDAKYWQSIREQNAMLTELVFLSFEYRKNQVEMVKVKRKLTSEKDDLEVELLQIELERLKFVVIGQERVARDRIRELREWEEIKQNLLPSMTCSLKDVNEHQLISYTQRWINELLSAGDSGSIPERNNLIGQLDKGLKMCKQRGCLDTVYSIYDKSVRNLMESNGIGG